MYTNSSWDLEIIAIKKLWNAEQMVEKEKLKSGQLEEKGAVETLILLFTTSAIF